MDIHVNTQQPGFFRKIICLENLPQTILTVLFALIPVFFIPSMFLSPSIAKSIFITLAILAAFTTCLILLIRKGTISVPRNHIVLGFGVLIVAYFVSAIMSSSRIASFIGYGFEPGTFVAILLGAILAYVVSVSFTDSKKLFTGQIVFFAVALLLGVFQAFLMFVVNPNTLSGTGFVSFIANTIGKTNEIGIFFGLCVILALTALETIKLPRLYRTALFVILILSFAIVAVINFMTVWYVLGLFILGFLVYQFVFLNKALGRTLVPSSDSEVRSQPQPGRKKIPIKTLVCLAVALLFIIPSFFGKNIGNDLSVKFGFNSLEVRPSWGATYQIFKESIRHSTLAGPGPNRFSTQWQLFRPDVNLSNYWSVNFDSGIGFVPTAFVETGIVGIVGWLVFLGTIMLVGGKALFVRSADQTARYLVASSFAAALFLWVLNVLYTPGPAMYALAFFFTGLLAASASLVGVGSRTTISVVGRQRASFAAVTLAVCVLIAVIGLGYVMSGRALSSVYFQKANYAAGTEGDLSKAEGFLLKAIAAAPNDVYYRMISNLSISRINNLLSSTANNAEVTDDEKRQFQSALANAVEAARLAIERDPQNFENKAVAGRVYETIIPVQIDGAYETAKQMYGEALVLSPRNPNLFLALARVEASKGNIPEAEQHIKKALELKWNYPDAIFLQSQIDVSKGNLPSAIKSVQQIAVLTPNDPLVYFRLGLLEYQSGGFARAAAAFEKSISLVPVYANAQYFLGLSYSKINRNADAIKQFETLNASNPGIPEIDAILKNLRAGKDPFANNTAAANPEDREELPVKEEGVTQTSKKP